MTVERVDSAEALRGIEIGKLPEGFVPLGVVAMVKCLDVEGEACWLFRASDGINDMEILGALNAEHGRRLHFQATHTIDEDDDEGDD